MVSGPDAVRLSTPKAHELPHVHAFLECGSIAASLLTHLSQPSGALQQGCYYHELFLRGHPNLVGYMRRVGAPKGFDRRKVKSQESDEPFFGSMPPLP
jgi:hypothetical protein